MPGLGQRVSDGPVFGLPHTKRSAALLVVAERKRRDMDGPDFRTAEKDACDPISSPGRLSPTTSTPGMIAAATD
jgi:hypothetical protein